MKRFILTILLTLISAVAQAQPKTAAKSALVIDADTHAVLYEKNLNDIRPIASITKLMNALVIVSANLPLDEQITVTSEDAKATNPNGGNLRVGAVLTRGELLHLSLMNSQNRAAAALGRTYPGGMSVFLAAMNAKAAALNMMQTTFTDPTGLLNTNVSTVNDLAKLATAAYEYPVIREFSITKNFSPSVSGKPIRYGTTNALVRRSDWNVEMQKTGYISDAGRCMIVIATVAARRVVMVLLNAPTSTSRQADATGLKYWVEHREVMPVVYTKKIKR